MIRIALDVIGGDHAPDANLFGALQFAQALEKRGEGTATELLLLGDERELARHLSRRELATLARHRVDGPTDPDVLVREVIGKPAEPAAGLRVRLVHAPDTIEMADSIKTLRSKPRASINVGCRLAAEAFATKGAVPLAFVSAGHSGAMMAAGLLQMGRLKGCERPAIAVTLPTLSPRGCILLDVGANVDCKPEHLRDFALMGALFASTGRAAGDLPRVALLSNGEERSKGNDLTTAAAALIDEVPELREGAAGARGRFIGYCEGKEMFKGEVDVVVADGFVGNVVLKSLEGLGSAVGTLLKQAARESLLSRLGFGLALGALRGLKRKLDYSEYGGAPLLGVAGHAFISHGRSDPKAIRNALLRAEAALRADYLPSLAESLAAAAALRKAAVPSSPLKSGPSAG